MLVLLGEAEFVDGHPHVRQPGIVCRLVDGERGVPHPQPGVTAVVAVRRRAAPVLDQEQGEAFLGRAQVLLGVHGSQQRVFGHSLVETMHEAPEGLLAADLLVEGLLLKRAAPNLFHLTIVSDRVTEDIDGL